jgi:small subunit ribosomal protein S17
MEDTKTLETAQTESRGLRKVRVGEVVSNKMDKTIVVRTITRVPHPKFGKITKHVTKFHAEPSAGVSLKSLNTKLL